MDFQKSFRLESRKSKPLMLLKDYLLDDFGSCSSSGFKSLPRRPSCSSSSSLSASVRFLIDVDLKSGVPTTKRGLSRSLSSCALFRMAAAKLVNAVKSPLQTTCFLPRGRGQTMKFLRNEVEEDVGRWSSFGGEGSIEWDRDVAESILSNGKGCGELVVEMSGFHVSEGKDAVVTVGEIVEGMDGQDRIVCGSNGPCSKECLKNKEQFSPVSVLNCPFEDDEETIDTQSESSPANVHTRRGNRRRGGLSRLAPVQLEESIASLELEEETPRLDESMSCPSEEAILERMLESVKKANDIPCYDPKSDVILLDFFREKLAEWGEDRHKVLRGWDWFEDEAVRTAVGWAHGMPREAYLGWEIEDVGDLERYEVCLEVDNVVWTLLVYEALIDIFG